MLKMTKSCIVIIIIIIIKKNRNTLNTAYIHGQFTFLKSYIVSLSATGEIIN